MSFVESVKNGDSGVPREEGGAIVVESRWNTAKAVSYKETLARLLATENITVEHRADIPTAAFDVKDRILYLPTWKDISKEVYDMLVLHEVGHALFTPFEGWHKTLSDKGPEFKSYVNVIEDARIEKKIKRKYPGGRRSFVKGYKDLLDRDFFGLGDKDLNTLGFIDRINMHFKGGDALGIEFSDTEKPWVARIAKAESWDEVVKIATDLWEMAKQDMAETDMGFELEPQRMPGDDSDDGEGASGDADDDSDDGDFGENPFGDTPDGESDSENDSSDGNSSPTDDGDAEDGDSSSSSSKGGNEDADTDADGDADGDGSGDGDGDKDSDGSETGNGSGSSDSDSDGDDSDGDPNKSAKTSGEGIGRGGSGDGASGGKPFSETDKAWRDNEGSLVDTEQTNSPIYAQLAADEAYNLDSIIISHDTIFFAMKMAQCDNVIPALERAKKDLKAFRTANTKIVNYLAKEFEMRKAAEASARAATSRTGVLNTNTLHSYKWNEDVFKKITVIPDGKSHGLVMFVDWSGSMQSSMQGTIEQILNLVMFCKKVNIPFDVYGFTDGASRHSYYTDDDGKVTKNPNMDQKRLKAGDFDITNDHFNLLHLASSAVKAAKYNEMLLGLIMLRGHFNHYYYQDPEVFYPMPRLMALHGTPLAEAVVTAVPIVNKFQADNGLQIVNTVFLTDGQGYGLTNVHKAKSGGRYGRNRMVVRDRKTHKEFNYGGATDELSVMLELFRLGTDSKIVNFYITDPRPNGFKREYADAAGLSRYDDSESEKLNAAWKEAQKDGGMAVENAVTGWDQLYLVLGGDTMAIDDEGLGEDLVGAKKGVLKRAFAKASTGKLRNRVLLRKFIDLIAVA